MDATSRGAAVIDVQLISARGLVAKRFQTSHMFQRMSRTTSNPFVRVFVDGQAVFDTATIKQSLDPVWKQGRRLRVRPDSLLVFEVLDHNKMGKHAYMGECSLRIEDLDTVALKRGFEQWLTLQRDPSKSKVRRAAPPPRRADRGALTSSRFRAQDAVSGALNVRVVLAQGNLPSASTTRAARASALQRRRVRPVVLNKTHVRARWL